MFYFLFFPTHFTIIDIKMLVWLLSYFFVVLVVPYTQIIMLVGKSVQSTQLGKTLYYFFSLQYNGAPFVSYCLFLEIDGVPLNSSLLSSTWLPVLSTVSGGTPWRRLL